MKLHALRWETLVGPDSLRGPDGTRALPPDAIVDHPHQIHDSIPGVFLPPEFPCALSVLLDREPLDAYEHEASWSVTYRFHTGGCDNIDQSHRDALQSCARRTIPLGVIRKFGEEGYFVLGLGKVSEKKGDSFNVESGGETLLRLDTNNILLEEMKLVYRARTAIIDMALRDAEKAMVAGARMGAFVLAVCVIDYMSCLRRGGFAGGRYNRKFIKTFLSGHDATLLWKYVRNGLVHFYSVRNSGSESRYCFTHDEPHRHKTKDESGATVLDCGSFLQDVTRAAEVYFAGVNSDSALKKSLLSWVKDKGVLRSRPTLLQILKGGHHHE